MAEKNRNFEKKAVVYIFLTHKYEDIRCVFILNDDTNNFKRTINMMHAFKSIFNQSITCNYFYNLLFKKCVPTGQSK